MVEGRAPMLESHVKDALHSRWTGVLSVESPSGDSRYSCVQVLTGFACELECALELSEKRITIYGALVGQRDGGIMLTADQDTMIVQIPTGSPIPRHVKEVCCGLASMSLGAEVLGLKSLAAMDWCPLVIDHLRQNGHEHALLGNIMLEKDVHQIQVQGSTEGCLWLAGFPCQAFSRQGDQLGFHDKRAATFHGVLKGAWLTQAKMVMLECVPEVDQSEIVHSSLKQLADALCLKVVSQILSLEDSWPCRRRRWWAVLIPVGVQMTCIPSMPHLGFEAIDQVIDQWGCWPPDDEQQLELDGLEIQMLQDPAMGNDQRVLNTSGICATFLHSYGSPLSPCPCGCRKAGLSPQRLARGGLRGMYVYSGRSGLPRWLHPREVALLQTLPPDLAVDSNLKATLVLLGQVAAPAQSLWVLANCLHSMQPGAPKPENVLRDYLEQLKTRAYHVLPRGVPNSPQRTHVWESEGANCTFLTASGMTISDMLEAEERWTFNEKLQIRDDNYVVPGFAFVHSSASTGAYTLVRHSSAQSADQPFQLVKVTLETEWGPCQTLLRGGDFVFQAYWQLQMQVKPSQLLDAHGNVWWPDTRVWEDVRLSGLQVVAWDGPGNAPKTKMPVGEEVDTALLQLMVDEITSGKIPQGGWMMKVVDSMQITQCSPNLSCAEIEKGKAANIIYGIFCGCGHWALFVGVRAGAIGEVHYFDGVAHLLHPEIKMIAAWLKQLWQCDEILIVYDRCIPQLEDNMSAVIALAHLGLVTSLRTLPTHDQLAALQGQLMKQESEATSTAETPENNQTGLDIMTMQEVLEDIVAMTDSATWVPSVDLVSDLVHDEWEGIDVTVKVKLEDKDSVALLVLHQKHWFVVHIVKHDKWLDVDYIDGLPHAFEQQVREIARRFEKLWDVSGFVMHLTTVHVQESHDQCGVVALANIQWLLTDGALMPPSELDNWHEALLHRSQGRQGLRGSGGDGDTLEMRLATLLAQKGVPEDRANERALAGLRAVGEQTVEQALGSRNPWAILKQAASKPNVRFMWVRHDELMKQVRQRAEESYGVANAVRKKDKGKQRNDSAPVQLIPAQLSLIRGLFVDDGGNEMTQIQFEEVKSQATGVAIATVAQVVPFLVEGKSLSVGPLAILTTAEVPHEQQGLLPVQRIRFPAEYIGTKEPVLVQGSLIQLGDGLVVRKKDTNQPVVEANKTCTLRLVVFRDEWEEAQLSWTDLCKGPVKTLFLTQIALTLCKGSACGGGCQRYHAPVDAECDSLITDLWDRRWAKADGGGRVPPEKAATFSMLMRVLEDAGEWVQAISGQYGIYVEPRQSDGKGPADEYGVVWLPQQGLREADHKKKTMDGVIAIARLGNRWGLRFKEANMEEAFKILRPKEEYHKITMDKTFLMYPLPHGTTRIGLQKSLKQWGWDAKPLQPTRGGAEGAGWHVGSHTAPPQVVLQGAHGDVVVTPVKTVQTIREPPQILGSFKTRSHLRQSAGSSNTAQPPDPWQNGDPWSAFRPVSQQEKSSAASSGAHDLKPAAITKIREVEDKLRADVRTAIRKELEEQAACEEDAKMQTSWNEDVRLCKLESTMSELRAQHERYDQWMEHSASIQHELGARVDHLTQELHTTRNDMKTLDSTIQKQGQETKATFNQFRADVNEGMQRGFNQIEALLAKRPRTASNSPRE